MSEDEFVLCEFYKVFSENKKVLFDQIASERTHYITVVTEDIYQEHNASAVVRTCEGLGIQRIHVIEKSNKYALNRDIALGSSNWIDVLRYRKNKAHQISCIQRLKSQGYRIVATSPHAKMSINELPLDKPLALCFGTEQDGISEEIVNESHYLVSLPMYGFTESYNISVSAGMLLFKLRERLENEWRNWRLCDEDQVNLKIKWCAKIVHCGDLMENEFRKRYLEKEL